MLFVYFINPYAQEEFSQVQKLIERHGLEVNFVFYSEGNGVYDNGIVLFLKNKNDYKIDYSFTIIFKADSLEKRSHVEGDLMAFELKTGSTSNLYFLPFEDKRRIKEVGITKIRVNSVGEIKE
jgi:hypothetical protein